MKKTYSKPQIMFEDFTLCTNIAAGCTFVDDIVPTAAEYGCGVNIGSDRDKNVVFTNANGCNYAEDDGNWNGICYYNPNNSGNYIFTS